MNQEHSQHKQQQCQTQEQLTRSEELLQQLHQQVQQALQKLQQRNPCNHQSQLLQDRHANVGTVSNEKRNIAIFGDSIPKCINRKILGQNLFNAKHFYRFFLGATSRDFFHYIKSILQDPQTNFDIAVLHLSVNDILNLGSTAGKVSNSLLHIANQYRNYGVKEVSISSVTCTTLLNSDLINDVNNTLRNKYQTSGYHFIHSNNITTEKLWKDGLNLNSGKGIIRNNFVQSLNSSHFLTKQPNRQILS